MRTTVDIRDALLRQAKTRAAEEGKTLRQVFESALQSYLSPGPRTPDYRLRWRSEKGRILPGVNLDDRDALFDLMDDRK
jgi:hypothetical protein